MLMAPTGAGLPERRRRVRAHARSPGRESPRGGFQPGLASVPAPLRGLLRGSAPVPVPVGGSCALFCKDDCQSQSDECLPACVCWSRVSSRAAARRAVPRLRTGGVLPPPPARRAEETWESALEFGMQGRTGQSGVLPSQCPCTRAQTTWTGTASALQQRAAGEVRQGQREEATTGLVRRAERPRSWNSLEVSHGQWAVLRCDREGATSIDAESREGEGKGDGR